MVMMYIFVRSIRLSLLNMVEYILIISFASLPDRHVVKLDELDDGACSMAVMRVDCA